jgi:hypothetical protein
MATPSGQIGLDNVNTELGVASTTTRTLNDTVVRTLAGAPFSTPGTTISLNDLKGKSSGPSAWPGTISTPQANLNLLTWASANGYPGTGDVQITVAPGVYVYANGATGATVYGMSIPAGFPGTVAVVNNGFIMGQGGYGTFSPYPTAAPVPISYRTNGQPAINISKPVTITNNSYIAGGGGGSGGAPGVASVFGGGGAGGAGGGAGSLVFATPGSGLSPGGAGGGIGSAGSNGGTANATGGAGGAGGGRILPGTGGSGANSSGGGVSPQVSATGGGAGGGGGAMSRRAGPATFFQFALGGGGGWGAAAGVSLSGNAAPSSAINRIGGNGGAAGAAGATGTVSGFSAPSVHPGGIGGKAINLNANTVTWGATGTIYGAVS